MEIQKKENSTNMRTNSQRRLAPLGAPAAEAGGFKENVVVPGRLNEPLRQPARAKGPGIPTAFGQRIPSATGARPPKKPPLLPKGDPDAFDKKEWIRELKQMQKDYVLEGRDRYRPLLCIKRDMQEFILDCEKNEKKDFVAIRREQDTHQDFLQK